MARIRLGKDTSGRALVLDDTTLAKIRWAEKELGQRLTIVQGSYVSSTAASAGTHDAGGVVDIRTWDLKGSIEKTVEVLRRAGLIAWYRTRAQGFDPHIHAIDYGNPNLSSAARKQVAAWEKGRNGLASNGPDDGPRVTVPKQVPATTLGPLAKRGIDAWLAAEERAKAKPTAANKAVVAALRAPITVEQLVAARAWKVGLKIAAEKRGRKQEGIGQARRIALIDSLVIKKQKGK